MLMNQKLGALPGARDRDRAGAPTRNVALVTGGSRGLGAELVSGLLARRYAVRGDTVDFPRLFARLGVETRGSTVTLNDAASEAWLRRAIVWGARTR